MANVTTDPQPDKHYPLIVQIVLVGGLVAIVGAFIGAIIGCLWWLFDSIFVNHDGFAWSWHLGGPRPGDHLLLLWVIGMALPFALALADRRKPKGGGS
jgi:hypothetical protein